MRKGFALSNESVMSVSTKPGTDDADRDAVGVVERAGRQREGDDGRLARRVGGRIGRRREGRDRAEQRDLSPAARAHARRERRERVHHAIEVDVEEVLRPGQVLDGAGGGVTIVTPALAITQSVASASSAAIRKARIASRSRTSIWPIRTRAPLARGGDGDLCSRTRVAADQRERDAGRRVFDRQRPAQPVARAGDDDAPHLELPLETSPC